MGNGVVSIRVEALGVSITIVDGNIAIEQKELPVATSVSEVKNSTAASRQAGPKALTESPGSPEQALLTSGALPASGHHPLLDELEQAPPRPSSPAGRNGLAPPAEAKPVPPGNSVRTGSGKSQKPRSDQTKPVWSDEEVEKLRALYPTHSASAIGKQLGRGRNSVRAKAQHLGLRKDAPPTVTSKPTPKPRSLSAAATADPVLTALPGSPGDSDTTLQTAPVSAVPLLDHHLGQCRWIVSDVWPVMYCGAPVVDCSSWCELHSTRVFNPRSQALGAKFRLKVWS